MTDLILKALSQYGVREWSGKQHNPIILGYFKEINHDWVEEDETAWCSAFMNWVAKTTGYEFSNKLNARSWLDVGKEITYAKPGDVVIFWRESPESWKGHVGIYINGNDNYINVLGGNQNNRVSITGYPADRVLGVRRLKCV